MSDLGLGKIVEGKDYKIEDCGFETPCWIWLHAIHTTGYGYIRIGNKKHTAHRVIHCIKFSIDLNSYKVADHKCKVRSCVNPDHIQMVWNSENVLSGNGITAQNSKLSWDCITCGGTLKLRKRSGRNPSRYCPICQYSKQRKV